MPIAKLSVTCGSFSFGAVALFAILLAAANANAGTSAPAYSLTDLGALPGTPLSRSSAAGLNDSGQVVGTTTVGNAQHAFLYSNGTMIDLGSLNSFGNHSEGNAINAGGEVVGSSSGNSATDAFLYSGGTMQDIGSDGSSASAAFGINASGQIVGNLGSKAFLYSGGTTIVLNTPTANYAVANGINASGQVVGAYSSNNDNVAFLYSNGAIQPLGNLPGKSGSVVSAINTSGQIVGTSSATPNVDDRAFLYTNGIMQDLGALSGGESIAEGLNDSGEVVGEANLSGIFAFDVGFLYVDGTMYNLNALVVDAPGYRIIDASGINAQGQIAATAGTPSGGTDAVLLTPTGGMVSVPLPAALWAGLTMLPLLMLGKSIGSMTSGHGLC